MGRSDKSFFIRIKISIVSLKEFEEGVLLNPCLASRIKKPTGFGEVFLNLKIDRF